MLTRIDDLHFPDHYRLDHTDECYFIGEYTAGRGFSHSTTNQFIYNLKKSVTKRGTQEYWHKENAIRKAGNDLRAYLDQTFVSVATFVPVPPSCAPDDGLISFKIDPDHKSSMTTTKSMNRWLNLPR
jgi:hypothetical protein